MTDLTNGRAVRNTLDSQWVWLAKAAVAHILVEAGELELNDAIDALANGLDVLRPCTCAREIYERLEQYQPPRNRRAAA